MTARMFAAALGLLLTYAVPTHAGVDRPPQFIVMAFDNCTELERWQELTDFAAEMNRGFGPPLRELEQSAAPAAGEHIRHRRACKGCA